MTNEIPLNSTTALISPPNKPGVGAGAARATLAMVLSVLALAMSGYLFWSSVDEKDGKVVSPLVTETSSDVELENRLKAQENTLAVMNDTFKKQLDAMEQTLNALPARKDSIPDVAGATAAMQTKLADWDKQNAELRQQVKTELLNKSKNIAALALLEHVSRKAQLGLSFQNDIKKLEDVIVPDPVSTRACNLLEGFEKPLTSDTALLAEFGLFVPEFLAREKLDNTDNVLDKIGIQLQKLVVVRRKSGQVSDATPTGKVLDALQTALIRGDWPKATSLASTFSEKDGAHLPKDFAAWQERLRDRALTEESVNALQNRVLNDLQGVSEPRVIEVPHPEFRPEFNVP